MGFVFLMIENDLGETKTDVPGTSAEWIESAAKAAGHFMGSAIGRGQFLPCVSRI
jgi:hypothetical protein